MPTTDDIKTNNNKIDFKQKYINLKRKLKLLIYENESYAEELRKCERQLLQVSRDKSYLLDRLLQYEKIESSTSDSEDTISSDSEVESRKLEVKKKKTTTESTEAQSSSNASRKKKTTPNAANRSRSCSTGKSAKTQTIATQISSSTTITTSTMTMPLIKSELSIGLSQSLTSCSQSSKASVSSTSSVNSTIDGHMTSEELERHLESRRQPSALLMPEKTPLTVPVELFSNESSNGLPEDENHIHMKTIP